ncbi:AAA family ATPase [Stigmatella erecta]|uniref:AAA ATPase domain-containing protein n=1 Tax=Stigmatella erecta TaxID=83460 RepID=A0A1I0A2K6_9BACT|nr:AAA family ATPase [Stigmatella erecta]SES87908.1 AAA ATPase domain-containing protein [Stigmatella erecta]
MQLVSVQVGPFKSIDQPQTVKVDPEVTVLVGMNEAGKTVFLQALHKSDDAAGAAVFDPIEDYPRKDLSAYLNQHSKNPAQVAKLTYQLTEQELGELNRDLHTRLPAGFEFSVIRSYDNAVRPSIRIDEEPVLEYLRQDERISSDMKTALAAVTSVRSIPGATTHLSLTDNDKAWLTSVQQRIAKAPLESVVLSEVWDWLKQRLPKFAFFGEYELLPSKLNLTDLARRVEHVKAAAATQNAQQIKASQKMLEPQHRAVIALLRMADISVEDFTRPGRGYESLKARLEAISIKLTDEILEFWKQNEDLEVEVDIRLDPDEQPPFNAGPNIYLRIKNRRHRGVSTPFHQRSRGFTWFFSFLVWFDSVQHQLVVGDPGDRELILLLDEPGLNLHALAQSDFLRYIDRLAEKHQVIYTTHSPFMLHSDRLHQVRVVEDRVKVGTVLSENVSSSDPRTIFPLQAALGWTLAQNLFISERNLLVEGPSDLLYLKAMSSLLEAQGRAGLREEITIVPTGGLDKVVTFVALLGANGLKLAVLHDYRGRPEQRLEELVRQKMITSKALLDVSKFRDLTNIGKSGRASDIEDLLPVSLYLDYFNKTFSQQLESKKIVEADLPVGDRILERIERHLTDTGMHVRSSGGFNHYAVASLFVSSPPDSLDADTLTRFESLFRAVNALL